MSLEVVYRTFRDGDQPSIVRLLSLVFDGWPHFDLGCTSLDHWNWKYLEGDHNTHSIVVVEYDGKIVGCHHMYMIRIKIGDEIFPCSTAVDLAVDPDYRKMGISKKMGEMNEDINEKAGIKISYFVSGNPIVIKSNLKRNLLFPHRIVNLVRIKNIDRQLRMDQTKNPLLVKTGFLVSKFFNALGSAFHRHQPLGQGIMISEIEKFDERIEEFWNRVSSAYGFILEREREYLNWRYCDRRAGDYTVKLAEEDGQVLGYSVLRINKYREEYPVGFIIDLLTLPDRLDAAEALVKDAIRFFDDENINLVNCWMIDKHLNKGILERHGWIDSKKEVKMFYLHYEDRKGLRILAEVPSRLVHLTFGDVDWI